MSKQTRHCGESTGAQDDPHFDGNHAGCAHRHLTSWLLSSLFLVAAATANADSIRALDQAYWQWRALEQPFSKDDIPRIERPANLVVDWAPTTVARRIAEVEAFTRRWRELAPAETSTVSDRVDHRLVGSAIARAHWELSVEEGWRRNPDFYIDQTLGSVYELLLQPPPFDAKRQAEIVARLRRIPQTLKSALRNLDDMRQPFVQLAIDALDGIREKSERVQKSLAPQLDVGHRRALRNAMPGALDALEQYRAWLQEHLADSRRDTAIGRDKYGIFLRDVALLAYTPEQLLAMSRQEWERSMAFEAYAEARLDNATEPSMFADTDAEIRAERADEERIRRFLGEAGILSVPTDLPHYRNLPLPAYLEAWQDLGVADDFTGPSRLDQDGISYIPAPSPSLGFFNRSRAQDPRPIIVHEGVPGHWFQLSLGWRNSNPIRRHYYDSSANEGIGFYAEEMMLQAGLFDDNAHTRATLYRFMRLRALRVEVDVKLALGEFTLAQAAAYLERTVPMDHDSALAEAALFASTPGQAISYQIGKIQITGLLADARRAQGKAFSILKFNDFVWRNGNVPLSLQRWELLGDVSALPPLDTATSLP
jgi:uncharacterized protein (DUF885 family)